MSKASHTTLPQTRVAQLSQRQWDVMTAIADMTEQGIECSKLKISLHAGVTKNQCSYDIEQLQNEHLVDTDKTRFAWINFLTNEGYAALDVYRKAARVSDMNQLEILVRDVRRVAA